MKTITIEEETFDRIFDDFGKTLELSKLEATVDHPELRHPLNEIQRRWTYAFRTMQDRLRRER